MEQDGLVGGNDLRYTVQAPQCRGVQYSVVVLAELDSFLSFPVAGFGFVPESIVFTRFLAVHLFGIPVQFVIPPFAVPQDDPSVVEPYEGIVDDIQWQSDTLFPEARRGG